MFNTENKPPLKKGVKGLDTFLISETQKGVELPIHMHVITELKTPLDMGTPFMSLS